MPFAPSLGRRTGGRCQVCEEHSPSPYVYRYCKVIHAFTNYTCRHGHTCMHIYTWAHCSTCLSATALGFSAKAVLKGATFIPLPSQICTKYSFQTTWVVYFGKQIKGKTGQQKAKANSRSGAGRCEQNTLFGSNKAGFFSKSLCPL